MNDLEPLFTADDVRRHEEAAAVYRDALERAEADLARSGEDGRGAQEQAVEIARLQYEWNESMARRLAVLVAASWAGLGELPRLHGSPVRFTTTDFYCHHDMAYCLVLSIENLDQLIPDFREHAAAWVEGRDATGFVALEDLELWQGEMEGDLAALAWHRRMANLIHSLLPPTHKPLEQ